DVRDALWRDRTLVKAWTLRGTLHLHPADELSLWLAARRAARDDAAEGLPAWPDPHGVVHPPVSAAEVAELRAAVWDAFAGRALLRDELATEVIARVGKKHEGRLRSGGRHRVHGAGQERAAAARVRRLRDGIPRARAARAGAGTRAGRRARAWAL